MTTNNDNGLDFSLSAEDFAEFSTSAHKPGRKTTKEQDVSFSGDDDDIACATLTSGKRRGPGRPRNDELGLPSASEHKLSIYMKNESVVRALKELADSEERSLSYIIEKCCKAYLGIQGGTVSSDDDI